MKIRMRIRNFILYLLVFGFVVTGSGMGLESGQQVLSLKSSGDSSIKAQSLTAGDDLRDFEIREDTSTIFQIKGLRGSRLQDSGGKGLFFLCVLAALSGVSRFAKETLLLHSKRYVFREEYIIAFIQDMDGRKRIS